MTLDWMASLTAGWHSLDGVNVDLEVLVVGEEEQTVFKKLDSISA